MSKKTASFSNQSLYRSASQVLPGGVSAAARAGRAVGGPFYMARGEGSRLYDVEGNEYLDLHTSHGASLLGHGHPQIKEAIAKSLEMGMLCAYETEAHGAVAKRLVDLLPGADMIRFTATGTETTYYAVKLAREFTGRHKVLKFEGHFHGFNDYLQFNFWPPADKRYPKVFQETPGVPPGAEKHVIVLPFNDVALLEDAIRQQGDEIAAVILEPINYNSGGIRPLPGFMEALRQLTSEKDIILIFDEILSGFRTGPGCLQEYLGVTPDLFCIGKALGGGMPISAFGGQKEIMEHVAPLGKVMHSGTYNAPLPCIMAVNAFLDVITEPAFYDNLLKHCDLLYKGIRDIIQRLGIKCRVQATGARFNILFGLEREPINYAESSQRDVATTNRFFDSARKHGIYFFDGWHHGISAAHTEDDIQQALEGIEAAMEEII